MVINKNKIQPRIKRFYAIQQSTLKSYKKINSITTDQEIISIISELRGNHIAHAPALHNLLKKKKNNFLFSLRSFKNYIQAGWKGVVTSLIVNNKPRILEYIWQAEIKILQELQPLMQHFANDQIQYQFLSEYEKAVYNNLDKLDYAIRKVKNHQNVAA